ncbi:hypothetical protein [Streptomyces sp. NRRL F-5630]|uniref:hypothetical protein n=1 Tax=Streptomyces sp. NRRL F-5630 TaxID=1463864 RepID=UPI003D728100
MSRVKLVTSAFAATPRQGPRVTGDPDSEFLTHAAEVAFDLGGDRFRLTALRMRSRAVEFTETGGPAEPPVCRKGAPPGTGREARRVYDWQPAAGAPSWMNMAWLLDDLAAWAGQMAEDDVALAGVEAPSRTGATSWSATATPPTGPASPWPTGTRSWTTPVCTSANCSPKAATATT